VNFEIGSNHYRNADAGIEIDGMSQFTFEHNRRFNELMLRGLLFDQNGGLIGKIADSSLIINLQGEFEIQSDASSVKVMRRETEDVLLEVKFLDKDHIQVHKARLYSGRGRQFEVTLAFWRLADDKHSGETVDCDGKLVSLK